MFESSFALCVCNHFALGSIGLFRCPIAIFFAFLRVLGSFLQFLVFSFRILAIRLAA